VRAEALEPRRLIQVRVVRTRFALGRLSQANGMAVATDELDSPATRPTEAAEA
jgi:hypothetical protein